MEERGVRFLRYCRRWHDRVSGNFLLSQGTALGFPWHLRTPLRRHRATTTKLVSDAQRNHWRVDGESQNERRRVSRIRFHLVLPSIRAATFLCRRSTCQKWFERKLRSVVAYPNPLRERISILFLCVSINIERRMRGEAYASGQDVLRNEECRNMKRRAEIYTVWIRMEYMVRGYWERNIEKETGNMKRC